MVVSGRGGGVGGGMVSNAKIVWKYEAKRKFLEWSGVEVQTKKHFVEEVLLIWRYLFLQEIIGSVGGKLHTGRSRNDQVHVLSIYLLCQVLVSDTYESVADAILINL